MMDPVEICLGNETGGQIAVLFDGSQASELSLLHAVDLARERHGRITVIAVAPTPWFTVAAGGISPSILQRELIDHTEQITRRAVAAIPPDIPCTTLMRCGAIKRERRRVERERKYDTLIVAPRTASRVRRPRRVQTASALA